jgi:hypothetical protein
LDDGVVGHCGKYFRMLEELQERGVTNFNGFWPTTTGLKEDLQRDIKSFYNIIDAQRLEDLIVEYDLSIERATKKEIYPFLADKEEELIVSSDSRGHLLACTCFQIIS